MFIKYIMTKDHCYLYQNTMYLYCILYLHCAALHSQSEQSVVDMLEDEIKNYLKKNKCFIHGVIVLYCVFQELLFKEFFTQGDLEVAMGRRPIEMMDREKAKVPDLQIGFLDNIALPVFS